MIFIRSPHPSLLPDSHHVSYSKPSHWPSPRFSPCFFLKALNSSPLSDSHHVSFSKPSPRHTPRFSPCFFLKALTPALTRILTMFFSQSPQLQPSPRFSPCFFLKALTPALSQRERESYVFYVLLKGGVGCIRGRSHEVERSSLHDYYRDIADDPVL
ncbi:hypothetical protein BXY75_0178 [Ulvibacter antarcticus]|uniref:Uncharacterized protein n=1 Tax=Ulvibacter antarcticus TaxID=442714 RepID=A0A3L9Z660_9FLAO|nr:hypothetical protein BXY75_0178 [Ulvibacter antarcticus]